MKRTLIALSLVLCVAVVAPAAAKHKRHGPEVIPIPNGFQPEGIAIADKHRFFVSSRATGAIYTGSLRTGRGRILVPGGEGRAATGMKVDRRGRLWVSGAASKAIRVYDARTGEERKRFALPQSQFINDVVLTRKGAYFTDSRRPTLYFIPRGRDEVREITLGGAWTQVEGNNANGIVATRDRLLLVNSTTGEAFSLPQRTTVGTADARRIAISGGDGELVNADGLLLKGRTMLAVENRDGVGGPGSPDAVPEGIGEVSAVKLSRDLTRGRIVKEVHDEAFEVPSTIAAARRGLYVVNAKFNIATPTPETPYEVVKVPSLH